MKVRTYVRALRSDSAHGTTRDKYARSSAAAKRAHSGMRERSPGVFADSRRRPIEPRRRLFNAKDTSRELLNSRANLMSETRWQHAMKIHNEFLRICDVFPDDLAKFATMLDLYLLRSTIRSLISMSDQLSDRSILSIESSLKILIALLS